MLPIYELPFWPPISALSSFVLHHTFSWVYFVKDCATYRPLINGAIKIKMQKHH